MIFINKNKKNFLLEIIIIIFFSILIISFSSTVFEVFSDGGSSDFHLYPAKCVFQGINHYTSYLNRDGKCEFFMTQYGEYAQGFYILMYPFTFFEWKTAKAIWFLLNIILIFLIIYFLCNKFKIKKIYFFFLILLIFSSIVTKVTLVMGQQAIFTLFFLALPFIFKSRLTYILSGISYFKYSIGYGLFIFYLISKSYKNILLSLIPCFFGWIVYSFITNTNIFENLFQPIELTIKNLSTISQQFLFSFMKFFFKPNEYSYYFLLFIPSILLNLFFIKKIISINNDLQKLTCLCMVILVLTPHYPHDYVLIIPLVVYALKYYSLNLSLFRLNLIGGIYFLNFYRAVEIYFPKILLFLKFSIDFINIITSILPNLNSLLLLFLLILNLRPLKKY